MRSFYDREKGTWSNGGRYSTSLATLYCIRQPAYLFLKVFGDILQYKFAPDLIMLDAYETVESWMIRKDLNLRKLIPAMMRYSSEPHAK